MALQTVLNENQRKLLAKERELFSQLVSALTRAEIAPKDMERLQHSIVQLDELFLLVVVGEFNSGKSAFINALLGQRFLEEGVTPTTHQIHLVRYGPEIQREITGPTVVTVSLPLEFLKETNIVDTPGTNAVIRQHEEITTEFIPRSDVVLFVTSVDRPFTESERAFLERIKEWGKKVIIVLNKIDIIEDEDAIKKVEAYIADNSRQLLGLSPEIFPISAKLALQGKMAAEGKKGKNVISASAKQAWKASRFEPLEKYILETLDQRSRIRLKLLSPLGVAEQTLRQYQTLVRERLALLEEDFKTIKNIEAQLAVYRQDMLRDFEFRVTEIENHLLMMEKRGLNFFDETLRLSRIFDLINSERIRGAYEREVVADTPHQVEGSVEETIDWFVEHDLRQWQGIVEYLNKRRLPEHEEKVIGQLSSPFEYNRRALLDSVGKAAQDAVASYDKAAEARAIGEATQMAVAQAALLEAGAIGLGTLVAIALSSTVADFTGILAASILATLGLFVIPAKRKKAKNELQAKISRVRQKLVASLMAQFERELNRSILRIEEAIAPYTRFVRAEGDRLRELQVEMDKLENTLAYLKAQIERL